MFSNAALTNPYHGRDSNNPDPNGIGPVYTNPIIESNSPDPGVLALPDGSGYVLVTTSNYAESGNGILMPDGVIRNLFLARKKFKIPNEIAYART